MNRLAFALTVLACCSVVLAQDMDPKGLTLKSRQYHDYRQVNSEPPFGLAHVKAVIAKVDKQANTDSPAISPAMFAKLSTAEKFTYCMLHGDVFDQNCNGMPPFLGEEQKIFAFPCAPFWDQMKMSPMQASFLKAHRTACIGYIRTTMNSTHWCGPNLNAAIIDLKAYELIPDMVKLFNRDHKDQDLMSTFCVLMKNANFPEFKKSITYKKLYGDPDNSYKSFIDGNSANQQLCIKRAMDYYHSKKR